MKKTIFLSLIIALVYVILSPTLLYIPTKTLLDFGFNSTNPIGLITYTFLHISPSHLIGNLILLLAVGFIAEKKLNYKQYYLVYLIAGATSAIVYSLLFPENYLVGASAAISALLAIAFIIDIKKTFIMVLFASLIISLISPELQALTQQKFNQLQNKSNQLEQNLNQINAQIKKAKQLNKTDEIKKLIENKSKQIQEYNKTTTQVLVVDEGMKREKHAQTSPLVHLTGAFTGLAYLFLFRRELVWKLPSQIIPQNLLQKNLKKK